MAPSKRVRVSEPDDDDDFNAPPAKAARLATPAEPTRKLPARKRTAPSRLDMTEDFQPVEGRKNAVPRNRVVADDVLSHADISEKSRQTYKRNETKSRLLRLPPEVRNTIWEMVIGANTIHIWSPDTNINRLSSKRNLCRAACQREVTEKAEAQEIKAAHDTEQQLGHYQRHSKCKHANQNFQDNAKDKLTPTDMNLALLLVCRQIHNEAALLPYHNSTFSFEWIIDLQAFISHLVPTQVKAVQNITFVMHEFESNDDFEKMLQEKLSALKTLVVFAQFHARETSVDTGIAALRYARFGNYREAVMRNVLRLQRLPAEDVTVAAYNALGQFVYHGESRAWLPKGTLEYKTLKEFEKEAEEGLKKKW